MRDMANEIAVRQAIAPVVVADNTPLVGAIIDRSGFNSLTYVIGTGDIADVNATFTVSIEHGDEADLSDAAVASGDDIIGELAFAFDLDNDTVKVGYVGSQRYPTRTHTDLRPC
jgi:hypothetical protein